VWVGEVGIEGRQCVGCVINFNKNRGMFMIEFDDVLVVPNVLGDGGVLRIVF
jgi:hypothetical protein